MITAENQPDRRSDQRFPMTDGIRAYIALQRVHNAVSRHVSRKLSEWDLSVPKYGVILHLYDNDSLPLSELSERIFRGNSNLTTLIARMERDGLVQRMENEGDRRVKRVRLTPRGRELAPRIIGEYRAFLHQFITNCLSPRDQRTVIQLLTQLTETLGTGRPAGKKRSKRKD